MSILVEVSVNCKQETRIHKETDNHTNINNSENICINILFNMSIWKHIAAPTDLI